MHTETLLASGGGQRELAAASLFWSTSFPSCLTGKFLETSPEFHG